MFYVYSRKFYKTHKTVSIKMFFVTYFFFYYLLYFISLCNTILVTWISLTKKTIENTQTKEDVMLRFSLINTNYLLELMDHRTFPKEPNKKKYNYKVMDGTHSYYVLKMNSFVLKTSYIIHHVVLKAETKWNQEFGTEHRIYFIRIIWISFIWKKVS